MSEDANPVAWMRYVVNRGSWGVVKIKSALKFYGQPLKTKWATLPVSLWSRTKVREASAVMALEADRVSEIEIEQIDY